MMIRLRKKNPKWIPLGYDGCVQGNKKNPRIKKREIIHLFYGIGIDRHWHGVIY